MIIGLNALQVRAAKSGVGHYIDGLIDGLALSMAPDDELVVYATDLNAANYERDDPRIRVLRWGIRASRPLRLAYEWAFLPRRIKRDGIEIFHGAANFLPRLKPCPMVATIHDLSYWVHPERCPWLRRRYWFWMSRHCVRQADRIICVSEAARKDLERYLGVSPRRSSVVHEAAHPRYRVLPDCTFDSAPLSQYKIGGPFILHVGTLEPGKNICRLLDAFDIFRRRRPDDWRLVLVGDRGWLFDEIFEKIRALGLEERVVLTGHVPDEQMPAFYNAAEFFVFPSINEGFGLPPLEAMACGAPVIASNVSAMPEVLGQAPLYIDPHNTEAIAQAMLDLESDRPLRDRLRQAGFERARGFSWAETARKTYDVYRQVLQGR